MTFTEETRDELYTLLTHAPDMLQQLKYYGGMYSHIAWDNDFRIEKGALFKVYPELIDKLRQLEFDAEEAEVDLSDNEILCCAWFFKRHILSAGRGLPISIELSKVFYDVPQNVRICGQRLYLPFDGKVNHPLKKSLYDTV